MNSVSNLHLSRRPLLPRRDDCIDLFKNYRDQFVKRQILLTLAATVAASRQSSTGLATAPPTGRPPAPVCFSAQPTVNTRCSSCPGAPAFASFQHRQGSDARSFASARCSAVYQSRQLRCRGCRCAPTPPLRTSHSALVQSSAPRSNCGEEIDTSKSAQKPGAWSNFASSLA